MLGSGTAIAQVVNVAVTPILAALYGPDAFGMMAIFMGVILVAGSLGTLTYDSAIVLARSHADAEALIVLCLAIVTAIAALVFMTMMLGYFAVPELGHVLHPGLLIVAPLGVLSLGVFNTASNWMTRQEAFKEMSAANLVRSVGAAVAQIIFGVAAGGGISLILGRVFGQLAATSYLIVQGGLFARRYWFTSFTALHRVVRRFHRFPVYKAPQCAIVLIAEQAPALVLGIFFGPSFAGLYWLADRILSLPCIVLSESTAKVFYSEATKRCQNGKPLIPILMKTILGLSAVAVIPSILLIFLANDILSILGPRWQPASAYVQWMTLWAFFRFSCAPIMATYMVLDDQRSLLVIDSIAMTIRLPIIIIVGLVGSDLSLVIVICVFESLKIVLTVLHIIYRLSASDSEARDVVS